MKFYKLVNKEPVECESLDPELTDIKNRIVKQTAIGNVLVSTVFLMFDHGFNNKKILFETMVFVDDESIDVRRYSTWDEAVAGHDKTVEMIDGQERLRKEINDSSSS